MQLGQVSDEHIKIAELSRKIGQILVERGDYEQAMHQFQLGLTYLEGTEHNEVARIYNEIGRVYWHQGKLDEAQKWTEKAFELAERLLDPEELARLRAIAADLPFLIPGVGAQGGSLEAAVAHGPTVGGVGPVINSSRGIIYASPESDFAQAARTAALTLRKQINQLRKAAK